LLVAEGSARKRPAPVRTMLSTIQMIAGTLIAQIANYVRSREPNVNVHASNHFLIGRSSCSTFDD